MCCISQVLNKLLALATTASQQKFQSNTWPNKLLSTSTVSMPFGTSCVLPEARLSLIAVVHQNLSTKDSCWPIILNCCPFKIYSQFWRIVQKRILVQWCKNYEIWISRRHSLFNRKPWDWYKMSLWYHKMIKSFEKNYQDICYSDCSTGNRLYSFS